MNVLINEEIIGVTYEMVNELYFKNLTEEEQVILHKNFMLYGDFLGVEFLDNKSKYIIAYFDCNITENIVGIMKISRRFIENGMVFNYESKVDFDFKETEEYSISDTYIHIEKIEVRKAFRNRGIGKQIYLFLEDKLTSLDIVYESYRTIEGKNANLLKYITKCVASTDFEEIEFL